MNRRSFIASIPFLPSAAKALADAPNGAPGAKILGLDGALPIDAWMQTKRVSFVTSVAYTEEITRICTNNPKSWICSHASRDEIVGAARQRARARLDRQLAVPTPKLP